MGTANSRRRRQQLRRERHRRRFEESGSTHRAADGAGAERAGRAPADGRAVVAVIVAAVYRGTPEAPELVAALAAGRLLPGGAGAVVGALGDQLSRCASSCRAGRWLPPELRRVVRRRLGAGSLSLLDAVLGSGPIPLEPSSPAWREQVGAAVTLAGVLWHLPPLPAVSTARPSPDVGGSAHGRILERVRGLLAKAEATTFPEEADAFTAKAQELLARHNLDRAAVESQDCTRPAAAAMRRVWIDEPYLAAKGLLLHAVARANRCSTVQVGDLGLVVAAGHDDDLDTVELLFTSLLVQATTQLTAAGRHAASGARPRSRSYRQSFLVAFAQRIGERLQEAACASEHEAARTHGQALVPLLAARGAAAEEAIHATFAKLGRVRLSASDPLGWAAGTAAADLAELSARAGVAGETSGETAPSGRLSAAG